MRRHWASIRLVDELVDRRRCRLVLFFLMFEVWFMVPLPKGPLDPCFWLLSLRASAKRALAPWKNSARCCTASRSSLTR